LHRKSTNNSFVYHKLKNHPKGYDYYLLYGISIQLDYKDDDWIYMTVFRYWESILDYPVSFHSQRVNDVETIEDRTRYEDYCRLRLGDINNEGFVRQMMELLKSAEFP
jgi:hypothetical protein